MTEQDLSPQGDVIFVAHISRALGVTCPACGLSAHILNVAVPKLFGRYACADCGAYFSDAGATGTYMDGDFRQLVLTSLSVQETAEE